MSAASGAQEHFNSRLETVCRNRNSNLCVGLDPDPERLNAFASGGTGAGENPAAHAMQTMLLAASAAADYAAAFKPNAAFFEALEKDEPLMAAIGKHLHEQYPDMIALADAKRGDIGNTSAQYAKATFQAQQFDCITVNPLMGYDSVEPFLRDPAKGVFLLCLTSNPGADDFLMPGELYLRVAEKAVHWNNNENVGLVVGATRPEYLDRIRQIAPNLPLLIPGIGAQGGRLDETLDAIGARDNRRFLINASRSIIYPAGATLQNYAEKVAESARALRDEINAALGN